MDLRQLATLVAVADHRTFSAAAKALFTVQSNVSAHVARLERELGVTLVDRGQRHASPRRARSWCARARRIQAELDALRADVASLGAEVAGDARLGVIGTTARWLLPPRRSPRCRPRHPKVRLSWSTSATTTSLLPQLRAGALDAAVLNLPVDDPELVVEPLFDEDLVLVTPAGHPLADRREVTLAELADAPPPAAGAGHVAARRARRRRRRAGVRLRAAAEIDGVRLLAVARLRRPRRRDRAGHHAARQPRPRHGDRRSATCRRARSGWPGAGAGLLSHAGATPCSTSCSEVLAHGTGRRPASTCQWHGRPPTAS